MTIVCLPISIQFRNKCVNGFPWPFYNAEAGWFVRANNFMVGGGL